MDLEQAVKRRLRKNLNTDDFYKPEWLIGKIIKITILNPPRHERAQSVTQNQFFTQIKSVTTYISHCFRGDDYDPKCSDLQL